ncbi:hypothetical protein R4463_06075 [Acinetobacter baumannii]|uniref:hypothetical protein n=1 Tax=Acinetobacter baumannii TaxID=470 RepID=UPI001900DE55|nr:hypothetical protein [Acinetobacter baumannii]MBJ9580301.1 hypothetical protein [Acinetobacter baumannii]MDV7520108.1 hypothetical protein [Acinetobacter baumannii]HCA5350552.1 hypothetical protein [Acinetobacter baumannii]
MKEQNNSNSPNPIQTLTLEMGNLKAPIELKIDQVTDYGALSYTLLISGIISAITAYVTIHLVTKSNRDLLKNQTEQTNNLISNQNILQEKIISNQVDQQKKEVRSRNRQEWINKVRSLIADYLTESEQFMISVSIEQNLRILNYKNELNKNKLQHTGVVNSLEPNEMDILKYRTIQLPPPFPETTQIIKKCLNITTNLDLLLSSSNELDREIHKLLTEINSQINKIYTLYFNKGCVKNVTSDELNEFPSTKTFFKLRQDLSLKTKKLLKSEWERVKNLE